MDQRLVGQFKVVVRKDETNGNLSIEVVNYPVTKTFITSSLDESPLDEKVERIVSALLPSIRLAVEELYERALKQK